MTAAAAQAAGQSIKKNYPALHVTIFDTVDHTTVVVGA
jgi:hypothetical protein